MKFTLPINELLKGSEDKKSLELILKQAESSVNSRETKFTNFISAPLKEEVLEKLKLFDDLYCESNGGYGGAERHRISFGIKSDYISNKIQLAPLKGINIEGNFLFDRAKRIDFINSLNTLGASNESLGDLWLIRDRGAQVICTPEISLFLKGKISMIRGVKIQFEPLEVEQLNLPFQPIAKRFSSVEASKRIDAIASAGFVNSRSKITSHIKEERIRLNWKSIKQPSQSVCIGDRIQLENKGSIEIINIEITKKQRWRIDLLRQ